jgi:hypothetical protein
MSLCTWCMNKLQTLLRIVDTSIMQTVNEQKIFTIHSKQIEAMMSTFFTIRKADQCINVRHIKWRKKDVTSKSNELI